MIRKAKIFVICAPEISNILHEEIKSLGFSKTKVHKLGVELYGTLEDTMFLNLHLRTANKVLWQVGAFDAVTPDKMYKAATKLSWEDEIDINSYFNIDSYVSNDFIKDSRFANLKLKDAIVDRFVRIKGKRPDSGPDKTMIRIYLHWRNEKCVLYYDTSGGVIAKHGYRKIPGKAPMLESLAAATILASKWDKKSPFVNPMCGSGTLAIEAALLATNTAPGLFRKNFGFMHLKSFKAYQWEELVEKAKEQINPSNVKIMASDISPEAIEVSQSNARTAGMEKYIEFKISDFSKVEVPEEPGVVMLNPAYGERLGEVEDLKTTYNEIGDFFKQQCKGYYGYIFTGNRELAKHVGLRTKRKIEFFNAQIDSRLLEYELYGGSRK
ncbi:MAG: class I SAM-dependent RNA methyltransferase [Bacteroidota bacterium]